MIKATLSTYGQGQQEVYILDASKAEHTALVSPTAGNWGDEVFWKTAPLWKVDQTDLSDIRVICWECGTEFGPGDCCPTCKMRIEPELISDAQDAEQTRRDLASEYQGGY